MLYNKDDVYIGGLKRGQKRCHNCREINAARQMVCKKCNTPFVKKKEKKIDSGLGRGQKRCGICKAINAARQSRCKECGGEFSARNIPVKNQILNWKELKRGEYIKIVQGSGPYFIPKRDSEDGKAGERVCMGSTGVYQVYSVTEKGINTYGATAKNGGFEFLYMGEPYISEITGIQYEPYKIKKVRRKTT